MAMQCGSGVETVPNPYLMAQYNLLLTPNRPFPVQPTANAGKIIIKIFP